MAYDTTTHDPVSFNSKLDWANILQRTAPAPLDRTSLFESKADAEKYARGQNDFRELSGTSYPGQIITVLAGENAVMYLIGTGHIYTQAEKDIDTAWYEDDSENHVQFFISHQEYYLFSPKKPQDTPIGDDYTQEEKDLDDAWYAGASDNHAAFITAHPSYGQYTPMASKDTPVNTEFKSTRELIEMGTKQQIDDAVIEASEQAIILWNVE